MKLIFEATSMAASLEVNGREQILWKLVGAFNDFDLLPWVGAIKFRGDFLGSKLTSMESIKHGTTTPNSVEVCGRFH